MGRLVIPKEIRRSLGTPEGTPMEFWVEKDKVIIKKYKPKSGPSEIIEDLLAAVDMNPSRNRDEIIFKLQEIKNLLGNQG